MNKGYFEIIRAGINTTFQDLGRKNLYHIGIPFSGAMDNRNFLLANKLVGNKLDLPVIEFAYQGPLLKFNGNKINIVITGDVIFKIRRKNSEIEGNCYETYQLGQGDEIDILSTNKSVYGYLAISGEFDLKLQWGSCSINTKANIGSNEGKKLNNGQSPKWMQQRLNAIGQRPISALVDITNYVMFDLNRPLHAYDGEKISGNNLEIRFAKENEKISTLNDKNFLG